MVKLKKEERKLTLLKQLTFWPALELLQNGLKRHLTQHDLRHLQEDYEKQASAYFLGEDTLSRNNGGISHINFWINRITTWSSPTLAFLKPLIPRLVVASLFRIVPDAIGFIVPFVLRQIILSVRGHGEIWEGCAFALLLFVLLSVQTFLRIQSHFHVLLSAMSARGILQAEIYSKMLRLSSKRNGSSGAIVNLLNVDIEAGVELIPSFYVTWVAPLQIGVSVFLLWRVLGWSIISGIAVMFLMMAANISIAPKVRRDGAKLLKLKDSIVARVCEIICGIKIIKLHAWEEAFEKQLLRLRGKQVEILQRIALLSSVSTFLESCAPYFVTFSTLGTLMLLKKEDVFDTEACFVSMMLFSKMFEPMAWFPLGVTRIFQTLPSIKRIDDYFNEEEGPLDKDSQTQEEKGLGLEAEVELALAKKQSVAIIGAVGSGKSTVLRKILGWNASRRRIGYMSQEAWIQGGTIRENVVFDGVYDADKFKKAVELAELEYDLRCLPNAESTAVGERGMSLSGGQKQRISLARAVYADADLLLLDDPISAVDAVVGKRIFINVIGRQGQFRNRTRIVAMSDLSYLAEFDRVLVLEKGVITCAGSYEEFRRSGIVFDHIEMSLRTKDGTWVNGTKGMHGTCVNGTKGMNETLINGTNGARPTTFVHRVKSDSHSGRKQSASIPNKMCREIPAGVPWSLYADFCNAGGLRYAFGALIGLALFQAFSIHASASIAEWSTMQTNSGLGLINNTSTKSWADSFDFLQKYALLGALQAVCIFVASLCLNLGMVQATSAYCSKLYRKLIRAPLHTFEGNFAGGMINVFSKDLSTLDSSLRMNMKWWLVPAFQTAATVIVVIYSLPLLLLLGLPVGLAFQAIQKHHSVTTKQLKQMESMVRSSVISMVTESFPGLDTINAFGAWKKFNDSFRSHLQFQQSIQFAIIVTTKWLMLTLEMLPISVVFLISLLAVIKRDEIGAVLAGVVISSVIQLIFSLRTCTKYACEVDANMTAVERINKYLEAEEEFLEDPQTDVHLPKDWPAEGKIELVNFSASHFGNGENVLKNINLRIHPGDKIGIVGRTGAGKSSLALALFRLLSFDKGHIEIDGIDIATVAIKELRKRISIVPQEPMLFSGTIRSNLDFLNEHLDTEIWRILNVLNLRALVDKLPDKLEHVIGACEGSLLSLGERQLLCLGRALLRRSKILILDEATSVVDAGTQKIIARACRSELRRSTVLTIAHRHDVIQDCERVITVCDGRIQNTRNG